MRQLSKQECANAIMGECPECHAFVSITLSVSEPGVGTFIGQCKDCGVEIRIDTSLVDHAILNGHSYSDADQSFERTVRNEDI